MTNTLAPNHRWLLKPGPDCGCSHLSDMIASCGQPGFPAAFVPARTELSSDHRAPAIRFPLRAETETAERQLAKIPTRQPLDVVKVSVAIVGVLIAMIVVFRIIGLLSRGRTHVEDQEDSGRKAAHQPHVAGGRHRLRGTCANSAGNEAKSMDRALSLQKPGTASVSAVVRTNTRAIRRRMS